MFDLREIFDLRKIFAVPKDFLKSQIYCTGKSRQQQNKSIEHTVFLAWS